MYYVRYDLKHDGRYDGAFGPEDQPLTEYLVDWSVKTEQPDVLDGLEPGQIAAIIFVCKDEFSCDRSMYAMLAVPVLKDGLVEPGSSYMAWWYAEVLPSLPPAIVAWLLAHPGQPVEFLALENGDWTRHDRLQREI